MLTPHEAKRYLTEQLPERIGYIKEDAWPFRYIKREGKTTIYCNPILETEWQQIALWVEEKMTDEQFDNYYRKLAGYFGVVKLIILATYTTRANAMKDSGL